MKKSPVILAAIISLLVLNLNAFAAGMVIEGIDAPVTTNEIVAFKAFMQAQPADHDNNHNNWVYGNGGKALESLGMVYEITHDREVLDQMIRFADAALASRNDATNGRMIWTGKRELCWPNAASNSVTAKYSGSENGDVIAHIGYCAELILQTPSLWNQTVGIGDPHGFGNTYKARALTYVREMDKTMDSFVVPNFISTNLQYRWPVNPLYTFNTGGTAIPWNQQTMLSGGFLRLIDCHMILKDDAARVKKYHAIIQTNLDWFLSDLHPETRDGHTIYDWGYSAGRKSEDVPHGGYDVWGLCRAFEHGDFGIPKATMTNFANTLRYVIYDSTNKTFHMRVDGTDGKNSARASLAASWMLLTEYFPNDELYKIVAEANRPQAKARPLEAAFLLELKARRFSERK